MVAAVIGGFVAFAIIVLLIIAFSVGFVRYYQDKHESEWIPTTISITGLVFVLSCLALVPVDIFVTSSTMDSHTGERQDWADQETVDTLSESITIVYYVLYSILMFYVFLLIPFAYFFYEEYDIDADFKGRVLGALKYTVFTVMIMLVLFLLGFFLNPVDPDPTNPEWYLGLLNASNGIRSVCFIIACLTILGIFVFITYTAYGLSALPIGLIRGKQMITREEIETHEGLEATREKQRALQAKYMGGRKMTKKDKKELEDLEKEERLLSRRTNVIEHNKNDWSAKCFRYTRPIQIAVGVLLLLIAIVIFVAVLLTSIDRVANSYCGAGCGFILENPTIFNPLDTIFLYMSMVFPIDYIFMVAIFVYFFCATISGIVRIGIRFLWIHLYKIRPKGTVPQGLLLTCITLILGLLFVNVTLLTIAPDYSSFGYQKYCNLTSEANPTPCADQPDMIFPCNMNSPQDKCTPTAFATLVNRIVALTPAFGTIFMVGHWLFLLTVLMGFAYSIFRKKSPALQLQDEESDAESI